MGWFSRKVLLTLIDDATGAAFATTKMPPADLPESFAIAMPLTRDEYAKSGSLTLRLRKVETIPAEEIKFSQVDLTDQFDENLSLGKEEWISTTPLNSIIRNSETRGLPSPGADVEEVYRVASKLSELRESIAIPGDGVYCPICHIANVDLGKLRTPCPKCDRELLAFGWT